MDVSPKALIDSAAHLACLVPMVTIQIEHQEADFTMIFIRRKKPAFVDGAIPELDGVSQFAIIISGHS